ncbi:LRRN2 [Branchiostoma lanceolatum]|uniref:LRRN2 protein n=1 Tax=Branchiostoma lanceolatum TaxID=7740 RepID=A0A8J9Z491_BRALA|nr:LRRN2 [Branchiostoma lanceolatum]
MTPAKRRSLLVLVLLMAWGFSAVYSHLSCCEGYRERDTTRLLCGPACSFNHVPSALPPSLKELKMSSQNITNINLGDFPYLESLEKLIIGKSCLVELQRRCFESLPSVTELGLPGNNIRRLGAQTFAGLNQLEALDLQQNEIYHIDAAAFTGLVRLRDLFLSRNCLSSIPHTPKGPIFLMLSHNAITTIHGVQELKNITMLGLEGNKIQCDCTMRQIKEYILKNEHLRLYVPCYVGVPGRYRTYKGIKYVDWEDLRCVSPDVFVALDNGTATGNVSFTCKTNCRESLRFSWITPNGGYGPPSYEYRYSKNYTHDRKWSCKGSPVRTLEARRICFSVLNIPVGTEGTYTCQVTAKHTDSASASVVLTVDNLHPFFHSATTVTQNRESSTRPESIILLPHSKPGLSTTQLIIAGLLSVISVIACSVVVGGVAACISRCKGAQQEDNDRGQLDAVDHSTEDTNRDTGSHYENNDQFPDADEAEEGHYENNDQFSDTDEAKESHYENNDQFSDTDEAKESHYENNDQFSDTDEAKESHYENNDQFSESGEAKESHYENEDQFSESGEAKESHYENNDQFSESGEARESHYENDDQFSL